MNLFQDSVAGVQLAARQPEIEAITEPEPLPPPPVGKPAVKRTLLADDDWGIRTLLGRILESEGYDVLFARDGREMIAQCRKQAPDLVLLDLNMPVLDGWAAFQVMLMSEPMIPTIIITARHGQYDTANQLGTDALMEKPLNFYLLLDAIQQLLAETETERIRRLTDPNFKTHFLDGRESSDGNKTRAAA